MKGNQMKIGIIVFLSVTLLSPFSCFATKMESKSQRIANLLNSAALDKNNKVHIDNFKFNPEMESGTKESWRTYITVRSLINERAICTVTGRFKLANGKYDAESEAVLFHGYIDPGAAKEFTSGFVVNHKISSKFVSYAVDTECTPVAAISDGDKDKKILELLKASTYKKDVGVKVIEANFSKISSDKYWDLWESNLKIKSCYTTRMECSATGRWNTIDESINDSTASNPYFGVFPLSYLEKQSITEGKGVIKVRKEYIDMLSSFTIDLSCDPVYSEHPNKYGPSDKYWKQFLPKKNECK
jgi:hypothetical protein